MMYPRILSLLSLFLLVNACADHEFDGEGNARATSVEEGNVGMTSVGEDNFGEDNIGQSEEVVGENGNIDSQDDANTSVAGAPGSWCQGSGKVELTLTWGQSYSGELEPQGEWCNGTNEDVFLPGCNIFDGQFVDTSGEWTTFSFGACKWEGIAFRLAPGDATMGSAFPPRRGDLSKVQYRLIGTYSVGCTPNKSIQAGNCTQEFEVHSNEVEINIE